ncbi:hypothetical protein CAPTEDRAFT_173344 [Capitella teleta]|uniref:Nicolin-1 n=1 Tax=Capitella teleta TaxID=283909 RepID=R7U8V7_CAPTE|nr:hypothetical protein CAPTEDRAFT_173344 [Capitella teleta]|eukprot:ELT99555.1 hypothetical protein CAPTEDRAFT_173344 [Capitella teleta]
MDKPIACIVKSPQLIKFGDSKTEFNAGCSVIDVTFQNPVYVELQEIHFKNYYTASITVLVKRKAGITAAEKEKAWKVCVRNFTLMPHPHADQGGEEYFSIGPSQLGGAPLQNITALRFVLQQPSSVWKEFYIEDIKLFKNLSLTSVDVALPTWMSETDKNDNCDRQLKGVSSISQLSQNMQNLWALTVQTGDQNSEGALGRYDVDGSYEINLLSYT